jgi:uncharacterized protein (DUF1697 family)
VTVYVALLRGINVGGRALKMDVLRDAAEGCGFAAVQTYIQSGNVIFTSRLGARRVGDALHDAVLEASGVDSRVVIRTAAQLDTVIVANPYPGEIADPTKVSVCFLYDDATPTLDAVPPIDYAPDAVTVIGDHAYLATPNGMGRSKLVEPVMKRLGVLGTVRNWRTTVTLRDLAAATA